MTDINIAELAEKTAAELERRGWTTGLYDPDVDNPFLREGYDPGVHTSKYSWGGGTGWTYLPFNAEAVKDCKVCILGAARAVYDGDPRLGMTADGNGYDTFVYALADAIRPGWRDEVTEYYDSSTQLRFPPGADGAQEVVYSWNDNKAKTQDAVVAKLRQIAADAAASAA